MATIPRGTPPHHFIVPDTNILWHKDKGPAVNPDFDTFWSDHSNHMAMTLAIPSVVIGELRYQHTTSALKSHDRANEALREVSIVVSQSHDSRLSKETIHNLIEAKFDKWVKKMGATIIPIPVAAVDWERVALDAIWRRPPFIADPKNPDTEKGFRDLLILETLSEFVAVRKGEYGFVFVSNDNELRNAAAQRLAKDNRFNAFESLAQLSSYIKLTKENVTQSFIKAILARASKKFLIPDDPDTLWFKERIREKITDLHKSKFENLEEADTGKPKASLGGSLTWSPLNEGQWWIRNPEFVRLEGTRDYYWKSRVFFVRQYHRATSASPLMALLDIIDPPDKTHFVEFAVNWSSVIKSDGRFQSMTIDSIDFVSNQFRIPTDDEIRRYGLEKPPPPPAK